MTEAQKIRDRKMREIRSNANKNRRIKRAKDIIQDLERHGPAGLIHIAVLSNIIGRQIRIWNADGSLNKIIGKTKIGYPIHVEYHENTESIGHWTLRHAKEPDNTNIDLNNCLFSVIGSQIGQDPLELRRWIILRLKSNFRQLANKMEEILRSQNNGGSMMLMIGGARYCGTSAIHAGLILDNSQNNHCHGFQATGHPRGHASDPLATGLQDSIENYSRNDIKSGFLSRDDQDIIAHLALSSKQAQDAMKVLNDGSTTEAVTISAETLLRHKKNSNHLPKGAWYHYGARTSNDVNIRNVQLVLRHHQNQHQNAKADVFVHTFYPILMK